MDGGRNSQTVTSERSKDGKEVIVLRIKLPRIGGYRIVVSNDGYDQGYILEFHEGVLSEDQVKNQYVSEDQLKSSQIVSNYVTWKEYEVLQGDGTMSKAVLPSSVRKTGKFLQGEKTRELENVSFDWKSFGPIDPELLTPQKAQDTGKQYRKEIDRLLNR